MPHQYYMACLAVEQVLTDAEKTRVMEQFLVTNPRLRGANLADLLDMFGDADMLPTSHDDDLWDQYAGLTLIIESEYGVQAEEAGNTVRYAIACAHMLDAPERVAEIALAAPRNYKG